MSLNPQIINIPNKFSSSLHNYDFNFHLQAQILKINLVHRSTFCRHTIEIDQQYLKESKYLNYFFASVSQLYNYLISSFETLTITKNGTIMFKIEVKMGSVIKQYQCKIETNKHDIDENQLFSIKIDNLQYEINHLKEQNKNIKNSLNEQIEFQKNSQMKMVQYENMLNTKQQIINSVSQELKQLRKWKEQFEKKHHEKIVSKEFIIDQTNPLSRKFIRQGNKIKKVTGGSWDVLMNKLPISRTQITRYQIRQIKAGCNGSFMYGISSQKIKGMNRAQDSKFFIGYYQFTGNIYQQGASRKGGSKMKDGQVVTVVIDPRRWKIYWQIEGKREIQTQIGTEMRSKNLFLSIVVYNQEAELELL